jgi:hypothetical protein
VRTLHGLDDDCQELAGSLPAAEGAERLFASELSAAPTMPPRRSVLVAGVAEREREARSACILAVGQHAAPALAPLPLALVLHLLSLLPVDTRLRCAEVCRSLRAALEERSLWRRLDLSASGVSPTLAVTDVLLHAAVARARGELVTLDLTGCKRVTSDALLAAVTANGGALRDLRVCGVKGRLGVHIRPIFTDALGTDALDTDALEALLRAAPRLDVCDADVQCEDLVSARCLLRNEPPFSPLHARTFEFHQDAAADRDEAAVVAHAADLASYTHLRRLCLNSVLLDTAAALDAVVDAALTRRLTGVALGWCNLSPVSAPALVRLVSGGALAELNIHDAGRWLLDAAGGLALGNALRASSTLTAVSLVGVALWREPAAATALLGALTGHPGLRSLDISFNRQEDPAGLAAAGAALGALVAANSPELHTLNIRTCRLGDGGLRPLFDALPANTHLRTLDCSDNELRAAAFVRNTLLPAVRANSSLRELVLDLPRWACAREAVAVVERRAAAL